MLNNSLDQIFLDIETYSKINKYTLLEDRVNEKLSAQLASYKLKLTIKKTTTGNYMNGTIVSQSRAAGGIVKENASFSITVYEGEDSIIDEETEDNGLD